MTSRLDDLFESHELEPPQGFAQKVMSRLERLPPASQKRGSPVWLPWVAVIGGAALSLNELASFMFSAWLAGPAH